MGHSMKTPLLFLFALFSVIAVEGRDPTTRFVSKSELGIYGKAAVSSDAPDCSEIGRDIMAKDGSAVDAAIAVTLCLGVSNCHSTGIGGGFFMTVYHKESQTADTLIARERAPLAATEDMFKEDPEAAQTGGLAVAVPGVIKGIWEAHQKYGKLPWKTLFEPSIKICEEGLTVTRALATAIEEKADYIRNDTGMMSVFGDPETGEMKQEGDVIYQPLQGKSLRILSEKGADEFYKGEMARQLVEDIQEAGGIITMEDMETYEVTWQPAHGIKFNNGLQMYTLAPPSGGLVTGHILNVLSYYNFTKESVERDTSKTFHRIMEAMKFGYGVRTNLGDPDFVDVEQIIKDLQSNEYAKETWQKINDRKTYQDPEHYGAYVGMKEDHGTSHFSLVAPNGDAVSLTSTINLYFGSRVMSKHTGIILNDEMDDFSIPGQNNAFGFPPSPSNFIKPKKIPQSSMSPSVFVDDKGDVRMVTGASGGSRIISGTALVALRSLWFDQDVKVATDAQRLHHQLMPMQVESEPRFPRRVSAGLKIRQHKVVSSDEHNVVCSIVRGEDGMLYANSDYRKGGTVAGLD